MSLKCTKVMLVVLACLVLLPSLAAAQSQIAGTVKDESGGVLPGVTVEAASPALIEKTKSAVTDANGRFTIVDLRQGTYKVTFTLTGFSTVVRDGVEAAGQLHRHGERRHEGRRAGRDHHGLGPDAARRRPAGRRRRR